MLRGKWPPSGQSKLVAIDERGTNFTELLDTYVAFVRCVTRTRLIYISHLQGIDVRGQKGGLVCQLNLGDVTSGIGQIDVMDRTIYALTGNGSVYALRHPTI